MSEVIACPNCSTENPAGQQFCGNCGNSLELSCSDCGTKNPVNFRFCGSCGNPLASTATAQPAPLREERRWGTVVFADLSGFTSASERMDPEDVRAMVDGCMEKLGAVVERYGGFTEKIVGDELMALFGIRTAHGDDAERAVRAALEMQACRKENAETFGDLELHVGINTGEMLFAPVGPGESRDFTVMGDAVNVASRLVSAAAGGSVLVGEETYKSTKHSVAYEELPPFEAKGKAQPVSAWRALSAASALAERPISSVPIIGRDSELGLMVSVWERVKSENRPHLMTVMGPPGIGKTRLSRELRNRVIDDGGLVVSGRSLPYGEMTGYGSFVRQINELAGILDTDSTVEAGRKFDAFMTDLFDTPSAESARPLRVMLGVAEEDAVAETPAILLAARRLVEVLGARQPTLLLFEDIHWADPSLLDLIQSLGSRVRDTRVLLLCLSRPELLQARPEWGAGLPAYTALTLEPLSEESARDLAGRFLESRRDHVAEAELIAGRAGGNPLFIEELSASVAEEGLDRARELPGGIREIIASRLDSLPSEERQALLEASVVGKVFWRGAVARLVDGKNVDALLDSLEARDFVRRQPRSQFEGDEEFTFKHMLIQDVAYSTLPKTKRRESHATVARFIEEAAADRINESASLLAHHWLQAQEISKAIDYLTVAAERASRSWAKGEAMRLYDEAISLLPRDDEERRTSLVFARAQLKAQVFDLAGALRDLEVVTPRLEGRDLALALMAEIGCVAGLSPDGTADPRVKAAQARLQRVLDELNDPELRALASAGEFDLAAGEADFDRAWPHAELALEYWPVGTRGTELAILNSGIGHWRNVQGDFEEALEPARRGYEAGLELQSLTPLMFGGCSIAMALIGLNRPGEAIDLLEDLVKRSRELEVVPVLTGRALNIIAGALREIFDLEGARRTNQEAIDLTQAAFPVVPLQGRADLIYIDLAAGDIGRAQSAIPKLMDEVATIRGWHEWLVRGRLQQAAAEAALAAGDFEQATSAALESIKQAKGRRRKYETMGRIVYGSALAGLKRFEEARAAFEEAIPSAEALKHSPTLWKCLAGIRDLEYALGNDEAAAAAHNRAVSVVNGYASGLSDTYRGPFFDSQEIRRMLRTGG